MNAESNSPSQTHSHDSLLQLTSEHGQQHLLDHWDQLDSAAQQSLGEQIVAIDFAHLKSLFEKQDDAVSWADLAARADVPSAVTAADFKDPESYNSAYQTGAAALSSGDVAMILTAGGQGSRLGFEHPKGMYPIGPVSNRTLFQIFFEHVMARAGQFETRIPMLIMTSPPTHAETIEYLEANQYFGMATDDVRVFCQGTMPAVDGEGRVILLDCGEVFASPDGHGGMLGALDGSGCLAEMDARGIKHIFYAQIDNPLVQVCNPALIGCHINAGSEMTSQVVRKREPLQKVGNVVSVDGRTRIIEYSDLPEEFARQTRSDGSLKLWAGSIAVHIFTTDFLKRSAADSGSLPFHRASKKVPFMNPDGVVVQPDAPNATKFERFIFDLLPRADNAIVCEVEPSEGFCAVKNAPPASSETPDHVREAISALHSGWLMSAGADVADKTVVEISPFFAVEPSQVAAKVNPGDSFSGEVFLT